MLEELQPIAESLAARLNRSVTIDDPQFRLLAYTAQRDERTDRLRTMSIMQREVSSADKTRKRLARHGIAKCTEPMRIPGDPALGMMGRVCVPIRSLGLLFGHIWLLDPDGSLSDEELGWSAEAAKAAGEILARTQRVGDLDKVRERKILQDLLTGDGRANVGAAQQLVAAGVLHAGSKVTVIVVQFESHRRDEAATRVNAALAHASRLLSPVRSVFAVGDRSGILLVGCRETPELRRLQEIVQLLSRELSDAETSFDFRVGIGPILDSIEQADVSYQGAQDSLRIAAAIPGSGAVTSWDALGIYRLLVRVPADQLRETAIPPGLFDLVDADPSGVMLETLETYLDQAGNVPASIERLHIHRTSLYYRLGRIEHFTRMDLGSGSNRLALHIGTKVLRLTEAEGRSLNTSAV